MDRFALRMSLVDLTGAVARWAHVLSAGLEKVGRGDSAVVLAAGPPFSSGEVETEDFERLREFIEHGADLIEMVLADDARDSPTP